MAKTIRAYVLGLLAEGVPFDVVHSRAQAKFPHRCVGLSYVMRLMREHRMKTEVDELRNLMGQDRD